MQTRSIAHASEGFQLCYLSLQAMQVGIHSTPQQNIVKPYIFYALVHLLKKTYLTLSDDGMCAHLKAKHHR